MLSRSLTTDVSFCLALLVRFTDAFVVATGSTRFAMSVYLWLSPWNHVPSAIVAGQGDLARRSRFQCDRHRAWGRISATTGSSTDPSSFVGIHRSISFGKIKCQSDEYCCERSMFTHLCRVILSFARLFQTSSIKPNKVSRSTTQFFGLFELLSTLWQRHRSSIGGFQRCLTRTDEERRPKWRKSIGIRFSIGWISSFSTNVRLRDVSQWFYSRYVSLRPCQQRVENERNRCFSFV